MSWNEWLVFWAGFTVGSLAGVALVAFFFARVARQLTAEAEAARDALRKEQERLRKGYALRAEGRL